MTFSAGNKGSRSCPASAAQGRLSVIWSSPTVNYSWNSHSASSADTWRTELRHRDALTVCGSFPPRGDPRYSTNEEEKAAAGWWKVPAPHSLWYERAEDAVHVTDEGRGWVCVWEEDSCPNLWQLRLLRCKSLIPNIILIRSASGWVNKRHRLTVKPEYYLTSRSFALITP